MFSKRGWYILVIILVLVLVLSVPGAAVVAPRPVDILVAVDDRPMEIQHSVLNDGGTFLLAARDLGAIFGFSVKYDPRTKVVALENPQYRLELPIGRQTAYVNGQPADLGHPIRTVNGTTYLPLRELVQAMGWKVIWDGDTGAVRLVSPKYGFPTDTEGLKNRLALLRGIIADLARERNNLLERIRLIHEGLRSEPADKVVEGYLGAVLDLNGSLAYSYLSDRLQAKLAPHLRANMWTIDPSEGQVVDYEVVGVRRVNEAHIQYSVRVTVRLPDRGPGFGSGPATAEEKTYDLVMVLKKLLHGSGWVIDSISSTTGSGISAILPGVGLSSGSKLEVSKSFITLAFVGDIRMSDKVGEIIEERGVDFPYEQVGPLLRACDAAFGNLETAVGTSGSPQPKQWVFQSSPETLKGLVNGGITAVSLANNHIGDYGPDALLETIQHLEKFGVGHAGAGSNDQEAWKPVILERSGLKIGFISASRVIPTLEWVATTQRPGVANGHDEARLLKEVADLSRQVDITVVSLHWGVERQNYPTPTDRNLAHRLVEAGADLVIGHHPHVLQGFEYFKDGFISYSLGNFVFTFSLKSPETAEGGILFVDVDEDGVKGARFVPTRLRWARPELFDEEGASRVLGRLDRLSRDLGARVDSAGRISPLD